MGGIRLKVIHDLLEREQPMLTGIFSTEEQQGRCPVVGAMFETLEEAVQRYVDQEFDRHLKDLVARQEMMDTARTDIEAFLKDCDPSAGLMTKIHDQRKNLRGSALLNLRVDWRALMRMLTSGDASLTDSLFDQLVRSGRHSPGHQVLALLTESLGWNLWLTTNFDTLIEQALRAQRIDPVVFELPENGPVPDGTLFCNIPSVVKLHGGSFALRVGESLDFPLDDANLRRFVNYFPHDALVLIIGYGGADWRVMSLINYLAFNHEYEKYKLPKILWVYRDHVPNSVSQAARLAEREETVSVVKYRSGGLFLRELHARLVGLHPASRTPYPSLPMVPPFQSVHNSAHGQPPSAAARAQSHATARSHHIRREHARLNRSMTVYACSQPGSGTTLRLAEHVRNLDASHISIWCEIAELPTLRAMVAMLLDQIRRYDTALTPKTLVPPAGKTEKEHRDEALTALKGKKPNAEKYEQALKEAELIARPLADQLAQAMRRGKYVIALDPTGEFGRHEFAHAVGDPGFKSHKKEALWQTLLLYAFLRCFAEKTSGAGEMDALGESKLCVAMTPLEATGAEPHARALFDHVVRGMSNVLADDAGTAPAGSAQCAAQAQAMIENVKSTLIPGTAYHAFLTITSAFRRPRSVISLRRLADEFKIFGEVSLGQKVGLFDRMMRDLKESRLLIHLEGGFYWMNKQARNFIYDSHGVGSDTPNLSKSKIHEAIADEYTNLLRQSSSLPSLYEAAYHLVAAYHDPTCCTPEDHSRLVRKIHSLVERTAKLLTGGPPSRVLGWIRALDSQLRGFTQPVGGQGPPEDVGRVRARLRELKALVLFKATAYGASLAVRERQLAPSRNHFEKPGKTPRSLRFRGADLNRERGRCLARLLEIEESEKAFATADQMAESVSRSVQETVKGNQQHDLRKAQEIRIRCQLGLAELCLRQVHYWKWQRQPAAERWEFPADDNNCINKAEDHREKAQELLETNSVLFSRDFSYLHRSQSLLEARLLTLQEEFPEAFRALDDAQAAVFAGDGKGDFGDLTDIRLQAAETLILYAAFLADGTKQTHKGLPPTLHAVNQVQSPDDPKVATEDLKPQVKAKLNRAAVVLEQARSTLLSGRPDVQRWARLGLLQAYLQHEILLFLAWENGAGKKQPSEPADGKEESDKPTDSQRRAEELPPVDLASDSRVQQGLLALGDVCELCWGDPTRREEVELLWLRFLTTFLFFRRSTGRRTAPSDDLDDWSRWNENADLRRFLEEKVQDLCQSIQEGQAAVETRSRSRLIHLEAVARDQHLPRLQDLFSKIETASSRAASSAQKS